MPCHSAHTLCIFFFFHYSLKAEVKPSQNHIKHVTQVQKTHLTKLASFYSRYDRTYGIFVELGLFVDILAVRVSKVNEIIT